MNPKYKKHEENYIKVYQNQTIEIRDEEKNFKASRGGRNTSHTEEQRWRRQQISYQKQYKQKSKIVKVPQ